MEAETKSVATTRTNRGKYSSLPLHLRKQLCLDIEKAGGLNASVSLKTILDRNPSLYGHTGQGIRQQIRQLHTYWKRLFQKGEYYIKVRSVYANDIHRESNIDSDNNSDSDSDSDSDSNNDSNSDSNSNSDGNCPPEELSFDPRPAFVSPLKTSKTPKTPSFPDSPSNMNSRPQRNDDGINRSHTLNLDAPEENEGIQAILTRDVNVIYASGNGKFCKRMEKITINQAVTDWRDYKNKMYDAWLAPNKKGVFIQSPQQPAYFIQDVDRLCMDKDKSQKQRSVTPKCSKTLEEYKVYNTRMENTKKTIIRYYAFPDGITCTNSFFNFGSEVMGKGEALNQYRGSCVTYMAKKTPMIMPFVTYEMAVERSIVEVEVHKSEIETEDTEEAIAREMASFHFLSDDDMGEPEIELEAARMEQEAAARRQQETAARQRQQEATRIEQEAAARRQQQEAARIEQEAADRRRQQEIEAALIKQEAASIEQERKCTELIHWDPEAARVGPKELRRQADEAQLRKWKRELSPAEQDAEKLKMRGHALAERSETVGRNKREMKVKQSRVQSQGVHVTFECKYEVDLFWNNEKLLTCDAESTVAGKFVSGTTIQIRGRNEATKVYTDYIVPTALVTQYNIVPRKIHITLLYDSDISIFVGGAFVASCPAASGKEGFGMTFEIGEILHFKGNSKGYADYIVPNQKEPASYQIVPTTTTKEAGDSFPPLPESPVRSESITTTNTTDSNNN